MTISNKPDQTVALSNEEKGFHRACLRLDLFKALRSLYRKRKLERGLTQKELAARLNTDPAVVSRRLKGEDNVTLDWVCDFARALDARVDVSIQPLEAVQFIPVKTDMQSPQRQPQSARPPQRDAHHYEVTQPLLGGAVH